MHAPIERPALLATLILICAPGALWAQEGDPGAEVEEEREDGRELVVEPAELELEVGETVRLEARVKGADGAPTDEEVFFFSRARRSVSVTREGEVEALAPGSFTLVARTRRPTDDDGKERLSVSIPVTVAAPPLERVEVVAPGRTLYAGTSLDLAARAIDVKGGERPEPQLEWASSAPEVATFDPFGRLTLHEAGRFRARVTCESLSGELELDVRANPVVCIVLAADAGLARTGDVVHFVAQALDADGREVTDAPIRLSVVAEPDDDLGPPASGQVALDGRFVAETPGRYTIVATCGASVGSASVRIEARDVRGEFELVGRGAVHDVHTSDLWVWEAADGRDYAVTGTWGGNGDAIFWDVTDPSAIEEIARVTVDARTVNDVKVSADGKLCVISREGASNRKNGIVLIDVLDPRDPRVVSTFDEELTGGVHNLFIDGNHVYALSAGRRYDVIDVADRSTPRRVGTYELDTPGHAIHDVWIEDGLAYSSNWGDGVHIVDVGNGMRGGSPEEPAHVASYAYPSGWNHAAFPYHSEATGRYYVVAGDEAFPYGLNLKDRPTYPRGWLHFIDFTDLERPREVARYEVPEAGTHNLWIEGDVCYVAYYNGGLRAVDLSGELMGDLYRQGREIAFFIPDEPEGYIANAPMAWGPQPHKGHVFFSDWNSGLWCVKLELPEVLRGAASGVAATPEAGESPGAPAPSEASATGTDTGRSEASGR